MLRRLTNENYKSVQVEVTFALAFLFILGPDHRDHAKHLGHEDHGAGGLVDVLLVVVVELLLEEDPGLLVLVDAQGFRPWIVVISVNGPNLAADAMHILCFI